MAEALRIPQDTWRWLLLAIAVMVAVDVALAILQFTGVSLPKSLVDALDLAQEGSIPTWFSSAQLLVAAMLLGVIAVSRSRAKDPQRFAWIALTIGFLFL